VKTFDGKTLRRIILSGARRVERHAQEIDALNVFPVPDGDTGNNMSLTFLAAVAEIEGLDTADAAEVARAASGGALRGARGNSGVVLSQLFRGFARGIEGRREVDAAALADGLARASETAYKAVMKPKEGTMLTVARAVAEKAKECAFDPEDLTALLEELTRHANGVLAKTVDMLPELKKAGVVDAGGKGLVCFLEGACDALRGREEAGPLGPEAPVGPASSPGPAAARPPVYPAGADIRYGYCTEFFIKTEGARAEADGEAAEAALKKYLPDVGDSIVVVSDTGLVKIHVHTNHPGSVLEFALQFGALSNLKIENMREQHTNFISFAPPPPAGRSGAEVPAPPVGGSDAEVPAPPVSLLKGAQKDAGFVAVAAGDGMMNLFRELGADVVIEGGQTMNPSAESILSAVSQIEAATVYVLPNNKNVILTAHQAADLAQGRTVRVVPSATVPQGLAALIRYMPTLGPEENLAAMTLALGEVRTGLVTYAVRDAVLDDKEIRGGDILCLVENRIEIVAKDPLFGVKLLIEKMMAECDPQFVSVYRGAETTEDQGRALEEFMQARFPGEYEVVYGGQPLYYYLVAVE
jgi:DAK2 domain fusion protein YloV